MGSVSLFIKAAVIILSTWLAQSRLLGNLPEARRQGSSLQRRLLVSLPLPLEGLRSLTATDLVLWLLGKLGGTRSLRSCSSASFRSSVWSGRLPKISRPT